MADDIVTRCEGGNDTRTVWENGAVMCAMCGKWFAGDVVPPHDRMDILAMLRRGDFHS